MLLRVLQSERFMSKLWQIPVREVRVRGTHRNPVIYYVGGDWVISVCSFEFVFGGADHIKIYLRWFENYEKAHRRQYDIIERRPSIRNDIAKIPARLFKASNRPKVIRALRDALNELLGLNRGKNPETP